MTDLRPLTGQLHSQLQEARPVETYARYQTDIFRYTF